MKKVLNKKTLFFFIFFLPFFLFLRSQNLIQIQNYVILHIASFQIILFFSIILISFLIKLILKKKNFDIDNLLISFSLCYFFSFFFEDFKFKEVFENVFFSGHLFSAITFFLILIIIFFLTLYFLLNKSIRNNFYKFIFIFVSINYVFIGLNFLNYFNQNENINLKNKPTKYNLVKSETKNTDIYYIVLDGMTSLEYAEEIGVIKSKNKIIENLNKLGGYYISNSMTNYPTTHLSIQSILDLNYPTTEKSKKYSTYKNFFPSTLINRYEQLPIAILNKTLKRNFFWTGNSYQHCKSNSYEANMCGKQNKFIQYLNSLETFYKNSFLDFFVRRINSDSLNKFGVKNTFEILNDNELSFFKNINFSEKNFFFMHLLKPHEPFNVDKNCNSINQSNSLKGYSEGYKCVLVLIKKFVKNINILSDKPKIIIFAGDHGWLIDKNLTSKDEKNTKMTQENKINRLKIFNYIFYPSECKDEIMFAKSPVNIIRFAYNCAENISIEYLPNKHYFTYYETHSNWGETEFLLERK